MSPLGLIALAAEVLATWLAMYGVAVLAARRHRPAAAAAASDQGPKREPAAQNPRPAGVADVPLPEPEPRDTEPYDLAPALTYGEDTGVHVTFGPEGNDPA